MVLDIAKIKAVLIALAIVRCAEGLAHAQGACFSGDGPPPFAADGPPPFSAGDCVTVQTTTQTTQTTQTDQTTSNITTGQACGADLIGGTELTDSQAAALITSGPSNPNDAANQAANNTIPTSEELATFHANAPSWAARVDGQCPQGLTTSQVLQWAALKWGISPQLAYADAMVESHGNQAAIGDNGRSSGILQVADRGDNHAWPGFVGNASDLARNSTCFNADFWAAHLVAAYQALTGEVPAGNLTLAIASWDVGYDATDSQGQQYASDVCNAIGTF